jgi:hypothetical protein
MAERYVSAGPPVNMEPQALVLPDGVDFETLHSRLEAVEGQGPAGSELPVGSIHTNTGADPSVSLGYGTWELMGFTEL